MADEGEYAECSCCSAGLWLLDDGDPREGALYCTHCWKRGCQDGEQKCDKRRRNLYAS